MSRETDQNKVAFVSSEQNMKDGEHDSESNFPQNYTKQQSIQTEGQLIQTESDPRVRIRERIKEVYAIIDQKRRRLLLKEREFIIDNLQDLQDALTKIIKAVEDTSSSENLNSTTAEAKSLGDRSPSSSPGTQSLKNYFANSQKSSPKEQRFDLNDLIEDLENYQDDIQQHYDTLTKTYQQSDIKTIYGERDRPLLDELKRRLDDFYGRLDEFHGRLDEFHGQLNVLVNANQHQTTPSSPSDLTNKIEHLQAEIKQANGYIEALQGNCRSEVARQLNHIKLLLGRIHMYTGTHGSLHLKYWDWRWGLPHRALLSLVERVNLAVSDAECGSSCTLELLRDTEVSISRIMYRYEYGLPFKLPIGWSINRINDVKRLAGRIKHWHNSQNDIQPHVIKSKVLLGLTITSSFWVILFITVNGLLIGARVAIAIFTPSAVQEKVEQETTQLNDTIDVAKRVLHSSQIEVEERIEGHIADKNDLINIAKADLLKLSLENPIIIQQSKKLFGNAITDDEKRVINQTIDNFTEYCSFDNVQEVTNNSVTDCTQVLAAISALQIPGESPNEKLLALQDSLSHLSHLLNDKADLEEIHDRTPERFDARLQDLKLAIQGIVLPASSDQSTPDNSRLGETSTPNNPWQTLTRTLFSWSRDDALNGHIHRFMLALMAGAIGSVISLLMRMNELEQQKLSSPFLLGLFQPLIGAVTSLVVVAILSTDAVDVINVFPKQLQLRESTAITQSSSGIDSASSSEQLRASRSNPVGRLDTHEVYKILIISFFVGFSERLAKDALGKLNTGNL